MLFVYFVYFLFLYLKGLDNCPAEPKPVGDWIKKSKKSLCEGRVLLDFNSSEIS
jgi:hypothetical protein